MFVQACGAGYTQLAEVTLTLTLKLTLTLTLIPTFTLPYAYILSLTRY